ncbi:hypothetical protein N0V88_006786 [Collariella sp. IMI 366227]|nr:hypothetical protein N0V88_006786 [Collariella sp. IMI 366227]
MMSFFPASFCAPAAAETNYLPLFRLLEDFDNYSRESQTTQSAPTRPARRRQCVRKARAPLPTFNPRFDVRETEHTYELHGELPGLNKENVNIEFTEPQTIVIRGRVERSYSTEADNTNNTAIESTTPTEPAAETEKEAEKPRRNSHQATVEDDPEDENTPSSSRATSPRPEAAKPATQEVAKTKTQTRIQHQPGPKYWLSERSIGEFTRSFSFPARVDHDGVTASLENGILSVTVPKTRQMAVRRIVIRA